MNDSAGDCESRLGRFSPAIPMNEQRFRWDDRRSAGWFDRCSFAGTCGGEEPADHVIVTLSHSTA